MPISRRLKVDLVFAIALLMLAIAALVAYDNVRDVQAHEARVERAEQVARRVGALGSYLKDAETIQRGFLLSRQERFLARYDGAVAGAYAALAELRTLMTDPPRRERFLRLEDLTRRRLAHTDSVGRLSRAGRFEEAIALVSRGEGQALMDEIRDLVASIEAVELGEVQLRRREAIRNARSTTVFILLAGALAVLVVAGSRRRIQQDLREQEEAEEAIARNARSVRALYDIVSARTSDFEEKVEALLRMGCGRFGLANGVLSRVVRDEYHILAAVDPTGGLRRGDVFPLADTYCSAVIRDLDAHAVERASASAFADQPCFARFGLETYLGTPVIVNGAPVGTLCFSDPAARERPFSDEEKDFLRLMAHWIGGELERRRAEAAIREREERFRSLVETASDIIYRTDLEGHFTYVNPTSVHIMGFPEERLLGMHYSELVREDAREAIAAFYAAQVAEGRRTSYYEFPAVTGDGREVWIGQNLAMLFEDGAIVGFQAVARDITRQRELERMKDEFLSVVSHELRTPLTAIRGSLGLVASGKMGTLEQRGQRMLEIAAQNTDRLVRLINDLLDFEKIESGRTSMEVQAVQAGELLERSAEAVSAMAERARVRIAVEPFQAVVSADPDRLAQVLDNLLSNAIKFSPEGATVTLGGELRPGEAVFWVRDQGRGIPTDMVDAIFERFQQVDSTDARQKGGTGLGLPIARSIVQQHGGRIWVQSQWGHGSTFFFSLPAADAGRETRGDDRPLVLVVDDDPGVGALVHAYLARDDFRSKVVTSGEEALRAVGELQPAVILLDLSLPGMSGREVLRRLRQRSDTRRIPVVVLTGAGEDSGLELAEIIGWVEKPIDHETLISTLRWAVSPRQEHYHLLVVEDNADLAGVIQETMRERGLKTIHASTGREAIELSRRISYDLLLLDPGLPDTDGFGLVDWLRRHNRHRNVPVVVYSARELDDAERDRLRLGPTEFFVKTRVAPEELEKRIVARLDEMIESGQTLRS